MWLPLAQVTETVDFSALFQQLSAALQQKNYWLLGALVVVGLVALVRKVATKIAALKFFTTDRGGAVLALVFGIGSTFATQFAIGAVSLQSIMDGLVVGIGAAGGYSVVKKILFPSDAVAPAPTPAPEA